MTMSLEMKTFEAMGFEELSIDERESVSGGVWPAFLVAAALAVGLTPVVSNKNSPETRSHT